MPNITGQRTIAGSKRTIAVVASLTRSLTNFRLELLKKMVAEGHDVIAFGPEDDADTIATLNQLGVEFIRMPMARTSLNPFGDLQTLYFLWREFRRLRPDVVLPYTMKPIIYGCLAARMARVKHRFALVTGLGHVFSDPHPKGKAKIVRSISVMLYRSALVGVQKVFAYNDADQADILNHKLMSDNTPLVMVPGSGVDLELYKKSPVVSDPPVFLLIARLLRDKGIVEFVDAARMLKKRHPHARFQLLGPFDPNPAGISQGDVDAWVGEGAIEYLGETKDVRPYLANCSAYVLPSYYREGIPRTILEAMAMGRAVITADNPGCRDTVENGRNGYIVQPRQPEDLAGAMEKLIQDTQLIAQMGEASHVLASERFDVHAVNRLLLGEMGLLRCSDVEPTGNATS
ncbi:MAG: glycosyltransferase family 4 protein [Stappiaceae bacterium]